MPSTQTPNPPLTTPKPYSPYSLQWEIDMMRRTIADTKRLMRRRRASRRRIARLMNRLYRELARHYRAHYYLTSHASCTSPPRHSHK
jgi:hypothetical protein